MKNRVFIRILGILANVKESIGGHIYYENNLLFTELVVYKEDGRIDENRGGHSYKVKKIWLKVIP